METHLHTGTYSSNGSFTLGPELTAAHELTSATTTVLTTLLTTTLGPHAARQYMRYNNQTVVDKVPEDMLHLIDSHWYIIKFEDFIYFSLIFGDPISNKQRLLSYL